jgi:hypothetical protein
MEYSLGIIETLNMLTITADTTLDTPRKINHQAMGTRSHLTMTRP